MDEPGTEVFRDVSENTHELVDESSLDLHVEGAIWSEICERVKAMTEEKKEFLVFLLAKEGERVASKAVSVGISHRSAVMWSADEAIGVLSEAINAGYKIVGDLHNHPTIDSYTAAGLPAHYATTPSIGDLLPLEVELVATHFGQDQWPRTIVSYNADEDIMYTNTYKKNRDLLDEEERDAGFDDPLFVPNPTTNQRMAFHPSVLLNPELVVRNGVISLGDVQVHSEDGVSVEANQLKSILLT